MTTLFVPEGTGPYNVEGAEYPVEDGKIEVNNRDHVGALLSLGASTTPLVPIFSGAAPLGERIASDFGPTQAEHDSLRAKFDALVAESETQIGEIEAFKGQIGTLADVILELDLGIEDENAVECAVRHLRAYRGLMDTPPEETPAPDAGTDAADTGDKAPGGTSTGADNAGKLADPGFTEESEHKNILAWLDTHKVDHPGNISKANAIKAVEAKLAEVNKG